MISLIIFIVIAVFIAVFTGFNIGNTCNVNVIFYTFESVPVFITIIVSFVAGVIIALPFSFGKGRSIAAKKISKIKARAEKDALKKASEAGKDIAKHDVAKNHEENQTEKK
ncbi:MAG: LapA family protein [Treponema sp.]|nr:LapA family protein [Treponema sp.]